MTTENTGLFDDPKTPAVSGEHTPAAQFEGENWYHDKQTDRFYLYGADHSQIAMIVRTPEGAQLHTRAAGETEWKEQQTYENWEDAFKEANRHALEYQEEYQRRAYITRREGEQNREGSQTRGDGRSGHRGPSV